MEDYNRRKFLKIVGSTSAVSMASVSAAATQTETSQKNPDLTLRNNAPSEVNLSVELYRGTDDVGAATPLARNDVSLPSNSAAQAVVEKDLDLDGGEYIVTASVDGRQVDQRTWEIPADGVPEWKSLSVHARGDGAGKIYNNEI